MTHYTDTEVLEQLYTIRDQSLDGWLGRIEAGDFRGIAALADSFGKSVCEIVRAGGGAGTSSGGAITLNGIDLSKFVFGPRDEAA